jgi:hypothetical protein
MPTKTARKKASVIIVSYEVLRHRMVKLGREHGFVIELSPGMAHGYPMTVSFTPTPGLHYPSLDLRFKTPPAFRVFCESGTVVHEGERIVID